MRVGGLFIASLLLAVLLAIFAFATEARLADGTELPIHWGSNGEADGFAPALTALLLPPGMLVLVACLFAIIPRMEPLQAKLDGSAPLLTASWIGMMLLAIAIALSIGAPAWSIAVPPNLVMIGAGLMLVMIGNALPKSRPGFFVGIRTPWAIVDTDNWIATHRLGGKLFMVAGVAMVAASLLPLPGRLMTIVVLGSVFGAALVPYLYSWWLWRENGREHG